MTTDSRLLDFVVKDPRVLQEAFDEFYKRELAESLGIIGQPLFTLLMAGLRGDMEPGSCRFHALALLKAAIETLVSSLQLIRQASTADGLALLRIALETTAVARWITRDDHAFAEYSRSGHKFSSTRAIACVRDELPQLPEFWGALSQATVHPNISVFGPHLDEAGNATIAFLRRELDPIRDRMALRALSAAAAMVLKGAELSLLVEEPQRAGWLRLPGTNYIVTAAASRLLARCWRELEFNGRD